MAVRSALHRTFLTVGILTMLSPLVFRTLRPSDGDNVSRAGGKAVAQTTETTLPLRPADEQSS